MTRKMREGCCATYCRAPATRSVSRKSLGRALRLHWNAAVGVPPPRKRHSRLSLVHLQASKGRNKSRRVSSSAQEIAPAGEMAVFVLRPLVGASEMGMSGEGWAFIRSQESKVESRKSKVNQLEMRAANCTGSRGCGKTLSLLSLVLRCRVRNLACASVKWDRRPAGRLRKNLALRIFMNIRDSSSSRRRAPQNDSPKGFFRSLSSRCEGNPRVAVLSARDR